MELADQLARVNAILNFCCLCSMIVGWRFIKRGNEAAHKRAMLTTLAFSVLFLCSYGVRIGLSGTHLYPAEAPGRVFYLGMLASHVILAAVVPFGAIAAVVFGLGDQRGRHRKVVRWLLPVWVYVSVTGIGVYLTLYGALGLL